MTSPEASNITRDAESIAVVRSGQMLVMLAMATYAVGICLRFAFGPIGIYVGVVAMIMSLLGVVRVTSGLAYSTGSRIFFVVLALIPIVGFFVLLVLISRASEALQRAESPSA